MPQIIFALILLIFSSFSPILCGTIRTFSASAFSAITFSNDLIVNEGVGGNGLRLNPNGQNPTDITPGRFRISASPTDASSLLISQWENFPNVPLPLGTPSIVPIPFSVARLSGQIFRVSGIGTNTQGFGFNGNFLYTERISSTQSRITVSTTVATNLLQNAAIASINPFSVPSGFRVDLSANRNGFQIVQIPSNGQPPRDVPSRFRISADQLTLSNVRISQSPANSMSPSFRLNVPPGFRVVRTNSNRFMLRGPAPAEQQFDIPSSAFNVQLDGAGGGNANANPSITISGDSSPTTTNNQQRNIPNGNAPLRDLTKSDGSTDCGPNIAHLCRNPLYAQLMLDQCPTTCANSPNAAAPFQPQQIAQQSAVVPPPASTVQQPAAILPPIYPPLIFKIGGNICGRKR